MRLNAGSRLGAYEITGPIGAGGMGEVYRARDERLGREVAIKVLPREVTADADRLARFEREARSASALNHPNIVTIHEFSSRDGEVWMVMELVRGESLRERLERGTVPLREFFSIAAAIADGLAAAHDAGLVHRDLKPENIMLPEEGPPKILDFGLARSVSASAMTEAPTEAQLSRTGAILGTAAYMSPEQARGERVDFRSDQFSFGLILHEMVSGQHPFRRATSFETLSAILNEEPPAVSEKLPEPAEWIIERCLAKKPGERYGSTRDLARDLGRLRDRSGVVPPMARPQSASPTRIIRWGVAGAILILAALLGWAFAGWKRPPAGVSHLLQVDIAVSGLTVFLDEVMHPMALSPDGRFLAIYGTNPAGRSELQVRDLQSGLTRGIAENTFGMGWSADSREIAYFADGKLKTVAVDGGPARTVCDARPEGNPEWFGENILFNRFSGEPGERGIYRVDAGGGAPELLIPAGLEAGRFFMPWWPRFLPDGRRFLYLNLVPVPGQHEIGHELMLGSLDGSPSRVIDPLNSMAVFVDGYLLYIRDGALLAQRFDPDKARLFGEATPLVDSLHYFRNTGFAAFSVSRNGILAWRSARRPSRLVWLDREGSEIETVATGMFDSDGRLSKEGTRYVVGIYDGSQGVSDIWIYDFARGNAERVTTLMLDEKSPIWARDGNTIYYRSDGFGGPPDIMELRHGEKGTMLYQGPGVEEPEDVSPDGKWLLFITRRAANSDIHLLSLERPEEVRTLVATPFNETSPRFSPDGRWIAYASDVSGAPEVYIRPFEEKGAAVRVSRDGGTRPRWSGDGRELYFLAPGGGVMAIDVREDFGSPRVLFVAPDAVDFEPAPDGSRFLAQVEQRTAEPPIHLMVNWTEKLRKDR
jgi:eukaryotic-like serine/threonine-protein kinase